VCLYRWTRGIGGRRCRGTGSFSLADPPTVTGVLEAAGFGGVTFTDVHEPVHYGLDVPAALDWITGFAGTREIEVGGADPVGMPAGHCTSSIR
jgi:hypothetical protein